MRNKMHPPFFWFTDERLRHFVEIPTELPAKKNLSVASGLEKTHLDIERLTAKWGGDESTLGVTAFDWLCASTNYLKALKTLSALLSVEHPFSYAVEFGKHRQFFCELRAFTQRSIGISHGYLPPTRGIRRGHLPTFEWH
ncbi:hypothetical protein K438DRAFT_1768325 [Mycena galopus ATCC 62051]|nr:hypothetical protein K438DRAFT_1768325 [Mycena galopus ATCC 62051]